ncbi:transglycosylase domain-containing protein [Marinomonas flavescens]|uniref:transglycosylase domain-containing protein n=1 Tax=Marinomonas flavescens TaxID=2529379 RepID=UPI00105625F1|nr:transglycosylase domain-containing protein [Marinomonas flavescens]
MAKRTVLRLVYLLMSLPMIAVAILCYLFNFGNVRTYYKQCINAVHANNKTYSQELIQCLYIGEDKRGLSHLGVDYIGIFRAILSILRGQLQGASTIEQQFVRTVVGRYERTLTRKWLEQLLSHLVCLRLTKRQVAESYLSIGFFGANMQGVPALFDRLAPTSYDLSFYAGVIARLKYPQPKRKSQVWATKHLNRTTWIMRQYKSTNKELKTEPGFGSKYRSSKTGIYKSE